MTTITANSTIGIDLNPATYTSPVVIAAGVTVTNPSYPYAVYRHSGATTFFVIDNGGTISASSIGVYLAPGGSVTNAATASIQGGTYAIKITGDAGTVVNSGGIAGSSRTGVELVSGGSVTNAASASISGALYGIDISGAGVVDNAGSITGTGVTGVGVVLRSGGSIGNSGTITGRDGVVVYAGAGTITNAAGASITVGEFGIRIAGVATVLNEGRIDAGGYGVSIGSGGLVTNAVGASITAGIFGVNIVGGAGTVVNDGSIIGIGSHSIVVYLEAGGEVTNTAGAVVQAASGGTGIEITHGLGTVVNDGSIAARNVGARNGVYLASGGIVTNAHAAVIASDNASGNAGVRIGGLFGTVFNYGVIADSGGSAIALMVGGTVTNAATATLAGSRYGIKVLLGQGTVANDGTIEGTAASGIGIYLQGGGTVTNRGTITGIDGITGNTGLGTISSTISNAGVIDGTGTAHGDAGILLRVGSVNNTGTIHGADGVAITGSGVLANSSSIDAPLLGVSLGSGGLVTNAAGASITGGSLGGVVIGGGGKVDNQGSITGAGTTGAVISLGAGGSVSNAASAVIAGNAYGVDLSAGGSLSNAGTIISNGPTAVTFGGTGDNLLVLDPGFGFSGVVAGGISASNTLQLASAAAAGSVSGLGTQFVHFGAITIDPGAQWSISGIQRGLAGPISGFTSGDTIVMTGVTATGSSFVGGILTLDEAGGVSATLDLPGTFTLASDFHVGPVPSGTEVTVACFCAGTRILTASGEVAVEELRIGDRVVTLLGCRLAPIVWLGHRYLDCVRHPHPGDVWPVRIKAGAIADGMPHRDLWLSPEHAVLLRAGQETVLVPIRHLLNGTTIAQVPVPSVTYWHVELVSHDAIVAEGLPAETYLDTGNRADFANGGPPVAVHPTFADAVWRASTCAPQLRHGDALVALQRHLDSRAVRGGVRDVRGQSG